MTRVGLCALVGALILAAGGAGAVEPADDVVEADGGGLHVRVQRVLPDGAIGQHALHANMETTAVRFDNVVRWLDSARAARSQDKSSHQRTQSNASHRPRYRHGFGPT